MTLYIIINSAGTWDSVLGINLYKVNTKQSEQKYIYKSRDVTGRRENVFDVQSELLSICRSAEKV
jgi:hypothetical protein